MQWLEYVSYDGLVLNFCIEMQVYIFGVKIFK